MVESRTSGRRRASLREPLAAAVAPANARHFAGQGRHSEPVTFAELSRRSAQHEEAIALGSSLLAQNADLVAEQAAAFVTRREARAAERLAQQAAGQHELAPVIVMPSPAPLSVASVLENDEDPRHANRREARAALSGPRRRHRFIATLPHQAAAAAAATGLVAAAMWQPAVADGGPKELKPDRASKTAVTAKDVKAAPAEDNAGVQVASVKAEAGVETRLVDFMKSVEADAATLAPSETKGLLSQPVTSVRITSPFGGRSDPWGGGGSVGHIGQDYGVKCGTPVYAAAAGTVTQAEDTQGHSGIRVTIDHGNGLETTYNHNSGLKVKVGDVVNRGDVVSLSGTTGNSTGCHLHLEVIVNKKPMDPAFWL